MPWLTSFAWAYSTCDEHELRITLNEKILPTVGVESGSLRLRSERAKRWAIRADKYWPPKGDHILPECAINSYLYRIVDVVNVLSCNKLFITLYSQQTS